MNEAEKLALKASTLIKLSNIQDLTRCNASDERGELFSLLSEVAGLVSAVSIYLTNQYFSHTLIHHSFEPMDYDTDEV
ncbi:hypothetical protein D3C86_2037650 [compost metagenome]